MTTKIPAYLYSITKAIYASSAISFSDAGKLAYCVEEQLTKDGFVIKSLGDEKGKE